MTIRDLVCELVVGLVLLAASTSASLAGGRCAYVDVGAFAATEPKEHCFNTDMTCAAGDRYGCFKTNLQLKSEWIEGPGGSKLRELAAPFGYIDPDGVHWDVPAGFQTDGASIPQFFQPLIGGPWTDAYIKSAVVHDFYIRRQSVNADAVHKVFYLSLLAAGTNLRRAQQMYFAVGNFGPQWKQIDMQSYELAWQQRKAMLDHVTKWHQDVWDAFQESERLRKEQAQIDSAVLSLPLRQRARVFKLAEGPDALPTLDAFIEAAIRDHIVHPDRDATLIKLLRDQVETELRRSPGERDNVFVVQFTALGATTVRFAARTDAELRAMLDQNDETIRAQEQTERPATICVGACVTHNPSPTPPAPPLGR